MTILAEELGEVASTVNARNLEQVRKELIQLAAVCINATYTFDVNQAARGALPQMHKVNDDDLDE